MTSDWEFVFFGMRRGGQHAIIHWLACHFDEPVWFVNDVGNFAKPTILVDDTNVYEPEAFRVPPYDGSFWDIRKKVFFQSYEDKWIGKLDWKSNEAVVGTSGKKTCVLILRDPFNMFASRMKKNDFVFRLTRHHVEMWCQHAREAVGATSFLPNLLVISYNDWVRSPKYRRRLENLLGLSETDEGLNQVFGVGSSFDRRKFDGDAQRMKVLERWRGFQKQPHYRRLLKRPELWDLSRTIFGSIAPDEVRPKQRIVKVRANMLVGKKLCYIRTPKTASTTIKSLLRRYACEHNMKVLYEYHESIFGAKEDSYDISLQHIVYKDSNVAQIRKLIANPVFITGVREPLERARSHYNHIGPFGHVNRFASAGIPFHEWYMEHKDEEGLAAGWLKPHKLRHWTNNVMATFLGYCSMDELSFDRFAGRYAFAFVSDRLELSWRVFSTLIGWKVDTIDRIRVASYDRSPVPEEAQHAFRERNKMDYVLYDFAVRRLTRQAEDLGIE